MRDEVKALLSGKAWPDIWAKRTLDALTLAVTLNQHGADTLVLCCKSAYAQYPLRQLRCLYHWYDEVTHDSRKRGGPDYRRIRSAKVLELAKSGLLNIHTYPDLMAAFEIYTRSRITVESKTGHSCKICRRLRVDLTLQPFRDGEENSDG